MVEHLPCKHVVRGSNPRSGSGLANSDRSRTRSLHPHHGACGGTVTAVERCHAVALKRPRPRGPIGAATHSLPAIQRLGQQAGNRAVTALLSLQRHSSYEHQMLGDTKPADIEAAVSKAKQDSPMDPEAWKQHVVEDELNRVMAFRTDPDFDPRTQFRQTRWIQLKGCKLWVSAGELAAFGDYLPDPETIDTGSRELILPILQRMRQEVARDLARAAGLMGPAWQGVTDQRNNDDQAYAEFEGQNRMTAFKGAAGKDVPHDYLPASARQLQDLDAASSSLGINSQKGLTARNACHFAPYSWERWALFHNQARDLAAEAHAARSSLGMPREMGDAERRTWVTNGYSNHFLQDSFAAGHLVNKTLVMQWFVEYNLKLPKSARPKFGIPDDSVLKGMTTDAQPDVAERHLYTDHRLHTSAAEDKKSGRSGADPQTTSERYSELGVLEGANVKGGKIGYEDYNEFLNSSYLQLASNDIHDWLNENGLRVGNGAGQSFIVGGDGSLLREDAGAIEVAAQADQLADQAISEIVTTGKTGISQEEIFKLFPTEVYVQFKEGEKAKPVPLDQWHDGQLREICETLIFPEMVGNLNYKLVRAVGPKMVGKGRVLPTVPEPGRG
jgi:hypothetical protein